MKQIDKFSKIFKCEEFIKDKYEFSLVLSILNSNKYEILSDEENYFLIRCNDQFPVWLWTKDNLDISVLPEIEKAIDLFLTTDKVRFICKQEIYNLLKNDNYEVMDSDYWKMGYLRCYEVNDLEEIDGYVRKATIDDLNLITEYTYESRKESIVSSDDYEKAKQDAKKSLLKDNTYFWVVDDIPVCKATVIDNGTFCKISSVYTDKKYRNKGYAKHLIRELTKSILEDERVALLYTDYGYAASNKAYKDAGYETEAVLINFNCYRQKRKENNHGR